MIDLYYWPTPNGHKITIALEEVGLDYTVIPVDIGAGAQFAPEFLKIGPNNKMPAIVDRDGPDGAPISVFESGAILFYLAEKTGALMPAGARGRAEVMQWLMFQMGGVGPMFGQLTHFRLYAKEKLTYAIERYYKETGRLLDVIDRRLGDADYLAGAYSIADIATWPWVRTHMMRHGRSTADYPSLARWFDAIDARPAVRRGLAVMDDVQWSVPRGEAWDRLFGDGQFERRA